MVDAENPFGIIPNTVSGSDDIVVLKSDIIVPLIYNHRVENPGETDLKPGELLTSTELKAAEAKYGAVHLRQSKMVLYEVSLSTLLLRM